MGSISKRAFERVVEEDLRLNVRPRVLRALVTKFDRNDDGRIYIQDFIEFCTRHAKYERPSRHRRSGSRRGRDVSNEFWGPLFGVLYWVSSLFVAYTNSENVVVLSLLLLF